MTRLRRSLLVLLALLPVLAVPAPASAAIATVTGQSTYVPQAPHRVLDTRNGTGGRTGALGPGEYLDLPLGLPAGATAAVLNVTATGATTETVVRVFPTPTSGTAAPLVSNLNVVSGVTVADLVLSKIGNLGRVRLLNSSGRVHLVGDLAGYYVSGGSGAGFTGTAPVRLLDTRSMSVPLQAGVPRTVDVTRRADGSPSGVPASATAVVVNLTAVAPTSTTVIRAYPGSLVPTVSNLNPAKGQVVANLAVVATSNATGPATITLLSSTGATDVVVDLAGWYVPGSGDVFHPVNPFRVLDTRQSVPVLAGAPRSLVLAGATSLPWNAKALTLTVTAVQPTASTFVTVYPKRSGGPPTASNLNLLAGQVVPNAVVVSAGQGGAVLLANAAQQVDLVVDVAGWFGPAGNGWDISWPQCTSAGSLTSNHPTGGAFAVVGVTHGPFTANTCVANEWLWASGLSAQPAAYVKFDANVNNSHWSDAGPMAAACNAHQAASSCGYNYGWNLIGYALVRTPLAPDGGKPFVWLDVEGPFAGGPFWSNVATNRAVVNAAITRLVRAGYRAGIYSDRASSTLPDWRNIMGVYSIAGVQDWVFRANSPTASSVCTPAESFSGGPVVMEQISTTQSGLAYDVDHTC